MTASKAGERAASGAPPSGDETATTLTLTWAVAAPREAVFQAWTEPRRLARWWWPARFETTYDVALHAGGGYRFRTIELPDLSVLCVSGVFLDMHELDRLVYTWSWEGSEAPETLVTVEFRERGSSTEIALTHAGF